MNKKKFLTAAFLAFFMMAGSATLHAQTKKTTTTKTTAKKKKTAAKKPGTVFICDGANGYTYHSRRTCTDLNKCKGRVLDMTKQEAISNYGRKQCKNCY